MSALVPEDRALGNLALGYWYDGGFKPYTIDEARAYYDQVDPNFISQLGHDTGRVEQSRVRVALASLALKLGPAYPSRGDFYGALADAGVAGPSLSDVAQAAAQGVSDFGSGLFTLGEIAIPLALLAAAIVYRQPLMAALKKAKLA